MRRRLPEWSACRAVIAVAALYALALQALLGAASFGPGFGPSHILCAPETGEAGETEGASNPQPAHGHLPCCSPAPAPGGLLDLPRAETAVAWPPTRIHRIAWRPEIAAAPRAPPGRRPSARAPPVV
ncbi:hypothetical protein [Methylobacterium sp. Leaf118]|uniref:hypothetical protein n=1 Tax=Methylobacterium sp. Leaf118 TaxID=2876562 RepID=UPI001E354646|nr:hypothetical protein [Methylobacterium sp. Leaf118]